MRRYKLFIVSLLALVSLIALPAASASAAGFNPFKAACNGGSDGAVCSDKTTGDPLTGPNGVIIKVTHVIAIISGVSAVIIIMVGGFMYVTSGGDSGKVSRAKDTVIYAAVGLIVIVISQSLVVFIIDRL